MKSMNIIEFSENLQARMKQELDTVTTDENEIAGIAKVLAFIRDQITQLKTFTRSYEFQNQTEEIQFFKEQKPVFLSQYYYYKKIFAIRLFDSFKDVESRQANYQALLQRIERYVEKNFEFYEYCRSGNTFMDTHYFTRNNPGQKSPDQDDGFSTGYDTKVSKILAYELTRRHVIDLLKKLQTTRSDKASSVLSWTGSKTDLIELIYALHSVNIFNNGAANIKDIASTFEDMFNISLGDYYRTFQDMRIRKRSQTPFLKQLQEKFVLRVTDLSQ